MVTKAILILLFNLITLHSWARDCGSLPQSSGYVASYCLYPADKDRVVVYFNGVNSTELQWENDVARYVNDSLHRLGKKVPSAISISLGRLHFLSNHERTSGKTDIQDSVTTILALVDRLKAQRRLAPNAAIVLAGMSMGGFNALQIFLRSPASFSRLALLCPASTRVSPFASNEEWERNRIVEGGNTLNSIAFRQAMQSSFGTQANWLANSPIEYARRTYRAVGHQPILISRASRDGYGFNGVLLDMAEALRCAGHQLTSTTARGEHCAFTAEAVARFLTDN